MNPAVLFCTLLRLPGAQVAGAIVRIRAGRLAAASSGVSQSDMVDQRSIVFELCAQTLAACVAASDGGAHRIELCRALDVDGLTPEPLLVEAAMRQSAIPVHVLLRPFADEFRTSPAVLEALRTSLERVRRAGAAGVVLGLLREDGTVDVDETRALVRMADPLPVTFHRAFDATPDLFQALEDVIATGCRRVLTSGGARDVLTGAPTLARLVRQAGGRVDVAMGGGLRLSNAEEVARITGGRHFHGSLRQSEGGTEVDADPSAERVGQMVGLLSAAGATPAAGPFAGEGWEG